MAKKEAKKRKNRDLKALVEEVSEGIIFEYKPPTIVDLTKNAEVCRQTTESSCWRPDIYLDLGCVECSINEHCACPIKKMVRRDTPKGRRKK
jgi:hypothetical protein